MSVAVVTVYLTPRQTGAGAGTLGQPVNPGRIPNGSAEIGAGRPACLNIERDRDGTTGALDGTVAVWGAMLPDAVSGNPAVVMRNVGNGVATTFDSDGVNLTYVAFANYNWLVRINGVFLQQNGAPSTNAQFNVSNPSGNVARITIGGAALPTGTVIEVYKVTPVQIFAAAAAGLGVRQEVVSYDAVWANLVNTATNLSATLITLETLGK